MSGFIDHGGTAREERRKQINLRDIFDDVVSLVSPYFQHETGLNGHSTDYWAAKAIHEAYSDLSSQEVAILTSAVARYCREHAASKASA